MTYGFDASTDDFNPRIVANYAIHILANTGSGDGAHLLGAKRWTEFMLTLWHLDPLEHTPVPFESKYQTLFSRKCLKFSEYHLQISSDFVMAHCINLLTLC